MRSVVSCPASAAPGKGALVVAGITCGREARTTSARKKGTTSTSRIDYRDRSGTQTITTTTTTPDVEAGEFGFPIVSGAFVFEFGGARVTVPFPSRELSLTAARREEAEAAHRGIAPDAVVFSIYKDVTDLARSELVTARSNFLSARRAELELNRGNPRGDEAAAQILMLSVQPEPGAADYFRARFGLPLDSPRGGWSNTAPAMR